MRLAWIVVASAAAALLAVHPAPAQEPDAEAKLAELGQKASSMTSLHLFGYATMTDRLDTPAPRVEEPQVIEFWFDPATGNVRLDQVKERSVRTMLVNDAGAYQWQTACGSPAPVGGVNRRDRAELAVKKDELAMALGPAGFVVDARSAYAGIRAAFAVSLDTSKDEMGLANATRFVLTPDEKKNERYARQMPNTVFRIAVDRDSGLIVCLRFETPVSRAAFVIPRIETNVDVKPALALPPAIARAAEAKP